MNLSIIIFCYNEEKNIEKVICSCIEAASNITNTYEIIVVDDGSADGTEMVVKKFEDLKYIRHTSNLGIGMAIRTGYMAATKEFVCAIPGDGQFNAVELLKIKSFEFHQFYSFYRPETNYSFYRKLLTKGNKFFNQLLLRVKLKDVNWIKVYRQDQLIFAEPKLKSSLVESEICAKLLKAGCTAIEIPSVYYARSSGRSTGGSWKTLNKVLAEMIALYKLVRGFKKSRP